MLIHDIKSRNTALDDVRCHSIPILPLSLEHTPHFISIVFLFPNENPHEGDDFHPMIAFPEPDAMPGIE